MRSAATRHAAAGPPSCDRVMHMAAAPCCSGGCAQGCGSCRLPRGASGSAVWNLIRSKRSGRLCLAAAAQLSGSGRQDRGRGSVARRACSVCIDVPSGRQRRGRVGAGGNCSCDVAPHSQHRRAGQPVGGAADVAGGLPRAACAWPPPSAMWPLRADSMHVCCWWHCMTIGHAVAVCAMCRKSFCCKHAHIMYDLCPSSRTRLAPGRGCKRQRFARAREAAPGLCKRDDTRGGH